MTAGLPATAPRTHRHDEDLMGYDLRDRNFLTLLDFTPRDIRFLIDLARDLKRAKYGGYEDQRMRGKDTARVLGRIYDGIEYRGFGEEIVVELADNAGVPVWNALTDEFHPTQILA